MSSSRYYEDKEADIHPGKISPELRAALNLAENDIPIWIYRMRAIGYPPGWLRKAIVEDIFDTDLPTESKTGKRKSGPDRIDEIKYDHTKIIQYPGFNTPLPPNTHDYHYYYNMPPMLPHQQLEYAKKFMREPAPLPPLKRSRTSEASSNQSTSRIEEDAEGIADNKTGCKAEDKEADKEAEKAEDKAGDRTADISDISVKDGIKLISKGSPMPKPERLPLEKFSQGVVGELLYFQNIPNSTGQFEVIRGLLDTMRPAKGDE